MKYSCFGSTGLMMSRIAFGLQTFGWSVDQRDAFRMLDYYTDHGGNYIDIADSYNEGRAEEIAGRWLDGNVKRDNLIIGTKVFFSTGKGINDNGLSRKHIIQSIDRSLRRLNTDYIDLYQIHCYDRLTPVEEVISTMDSLVSDGKIRYYGLSNYTPSGLTETLYESVLARKNKPSSLQLEYSILVRSAEWELLQLCKKYNLGVLAWSPLSGGWLSGKYRRGADLPSDSRAGIGDRWDDNEEQRGGERTFDIIEELVRVSETIGVPVSQVSLAWLLKKDYPVFPLIGARTMNQLEDNLKSIEVELSEEHERAIDEVSAIEKPYPYSFVDRYTRYEK